jgi:hypothetical protein
MGFPLDAVVNVEQVDDKNWKLRRALEYEATGRKFVAGVDMATDFASVPRIFVWLLPRYGRYTKAAIIHDYLWREGVKKGEITLREADALFRNAMAELKVAFLRRWVMWAAVRWGALKKGGPFSDWWRDFPLVLLFTALVLPVVGPPALLVQVALVAFFVLDLIVWLVLKAWAAATRKLTPSRAPKEPVNRPSLTWKL